jgi:hypothetical protein
VSGGFFLFLAWHFARTVRPELGEAYRWIVTAVLGVIGARTLLGHLWVLVRRTPALRASSDGVWFGGGPMIAWRDIAAVYDPSAVVVSRPGFRSRCVAFSFCRTRTLFRLPSRLWLTSFALGDVLIPVDGAGIARAAVIAQLDALRADAVASGAAPPEARVVRG